MKNCIIIPTYNEKDNISQLIAEIFSQLPDIDILIVDDNSPDKTADEVKRLMAGCHNLSLLERPAKNGLGAAYIAGFKRALNDSNIGNIIMMDGDFSHNPKYLPRMLHESIYYELVVGSRYVSDGGISKWEFWRKLLSAGGNAYIRFLLGGKMNDWTGGFNCINAEFLKKINLNDIELSGYAFIMGLKYALIKAGARPKEIPIVFEARRGGESKMSSHIIREGILAPWKIILKK